MILDRLTLFDFGLYAGRQSIELTPKSSKAPVILIGGLNGGGKTTFLDAITLALYGVRAKTSNRNGTAYPEYLRSCINRRTMPGGSASVELEFRHRNEGQDHTYVVSRSWRATEASAREDLEIRKDGKVDRVLTENWAEVVEEFLPLGLSRLFLFDGEKIETLAHVSHSQEALGTAMASLLGVDVVDQLCADLGALEARKRIALKAAGERAEIDALEARISENEKRIAGLRERRAEFETELAQRTNRLKDLQEAFRKQGGDSYENREALRAEASSLESRIQELEKELAELCGGVLPLVLVKELMTSVQHQVDREERAATCANLVTVLEDRDKEILELLSSTGALGKAGALVAEYLTRDRARRLDESKSEMYLSLGAEEQVQLRSVLTTGLAEAQERAARLNAQVRDSQDALVQVERRLQAVPHEDAIRQFIERVEKARIEEQLARTQRDALVAEEAEAERLMEADRDKLARLMEGAVDEDFGREDDARVAKYALRARDTLRQFRTAVVQRHVGRIERLVLDRFKHLLRKQRLVESARIDPESFAVELRDENGDRIAPERLSAGERQLFAVSLLWGLAEAAGRPLPTIIDTPLGRLDGTHREHLVRRYFPHASHQVILLSTDKEIDREYYDQLRPFIGREYRLEYDEAEHRSIVRDGYFW